MDRIRFSWAKYFTLVTIIIEWGAFILIPNLFTLSNKLPISQVSSTNNPAKPLVIVIMLVAAVSYAVGALYFNNFYRNSLVISIFAGICFSLTMFFPYDERGWVWLHLASAFTCMILYIYLIHATSKSNIIKTTARKLFKAIYVLELILLLTLIISYNYSPQLVLILEILMVMGIHSWALVLISLRTDKEGTRGEMNY